MDPRDNRSIERVVHWNGLRAALNAAATHPQQRATTEEAFTLLVRLGQAPACGTVLESFVRNAEKLGSTIPYIALASGRRKAIPDVGSSRDDAPVKTPESDQPHAVTMCDVVDSDSRMSIANRYNPSGELDQSERRRTAPDHEMTQDEVPSSVFLGAGEIAALAADLDPMGRVNHAFTAVAEAFGGEDVSTVVATAASNEGRRPYFRSPLHSYAVARRCRSWNDRLETVADHLATTRRRLGRRGQDLLLADSRLAISGNAKPSSLAVMPADELTAQAKAVRSMAARRQQGDEAGRGGGDGNRKEAGGTFTARIKRYAPLFDRSARGVRAFEGQRHPGYRAEEPRREEAGESVIVLEVSPVVRSRNANTNKGGGDGTGGDPSGGDGGENDYRAIGKQLAFAASALSIRTLRGQPGLMNVYSGAVAVEDSESAYRSSIAGLTAEEEGTDGTNKTALPLRVVCERLAGWRPLSDVIREHGPLATPSDIAAGDGGEGLRVLRLWGRQLASTLECLSSCSLVVRDLRASTVFVSPNGSAIKIVAFSSLATFSSEGGSLSSEAPALDEDIHGPTAPLTPPEALTITKEWDRRGASNKRRGSLVLADKGSPGAFPTTAAWDVWTLGILLFELAFGHPPPAFGDSLRQGLSTWMSNAPAAKNVDTIPDLGEVATAMHYDFLSSIGGQSKVGEKGIGFTTADADNSPLEKALRHASLGAAIGGRDPFRVASTIDGREDPSAARGNGGRKSVERFRRAWIRRQLQREESGETGLTTWQELQETIRAHLEVSVESATFAATTPSAWQVIGGGDESGGRRPIDSVDRDQGAATAPSSSDEGKRTPAAETATLRTAARLHEADSRGTGRIPFSITCAVLRDELQLSFSASEAELLAFCLREAGGPEDDVSGGTEARDLDSRGKNNDETDVFYLPLVHVLRAASPSLAAGPSDAGDGPSRPPTPTSFVEVLCACLEPNPQRRASAAGLLGLPFFSPDSGGQARFVSGDGDLKAASAYLSGTGNELSPTLALYERVEQRIQTLEAASTSGTGSPAAHSEKSRKASSGLLENIPGSATRHIRSKGGRDVSTNLGAGMLVEALRELERLVHRSPPTAHPLAEDGHHMQARRTARGHAKVVYQIFESGVLLRATALALRFLDQEEVRQGIWKLA